MAQRKVKTENLKRKTTKKDFKVSPLQAIIVTSPLILIVIFALIFILFFVGL